MTVNGSTSKPSGPAADCACHAFHAKELHRGLKLNANFEAISLKAPITCYKRPICSSEVVCILCGQYLSCFMMILVRLVRVRLLWACCRSLRDARADEAETARLASVAQHNTPSQRLRRNENKSPFGKGRPPHYGTPPCSAASRRASSSLRRD